LVAWPTPPSWYLNISTNSLSDVLISFDLSLSQRLEYLTLAVGNAKSHPVSVGGRHETAIAFLTELEEKLEVAQVQLEVYNTLQYHIDDDPHVGNRIRLLNRKLLPVSEVWSVLVCSAGNC
jgi:nuclear pore complex protein Nup155